MFLERIEMTFMEPCFSDPRKVRLFAEMSADISEMMPYLNAVIPNATYNPRGPTLCFMREFRMVTLHPTKIAIAKALNATDAWRVLDWIKDTINETYERRDSIQPSRERRVRATALDIYGWLPQTNCRECGEATCLAFAVRFLQGEQRLERCKPLFASGNAKLRKAMLDIVTALGYDVKTDNKSEREEKVDSKRKGKEEVTG